MDQDLPPGVGVQLLHLVDQVQQDLHISISKNITSNHYLGIIRSSHVRPGVTLQLLHQPACHLPSREVHGPVAECAQVGFSPGLNLRCYMIKPSK